MSQSDVSPAIAEPFLDLAQRLEVPPVYSVDDVPTPQNKPQGEGEREEQDLQADEGRRLHGVSSL